jgi:hypothetical protein
MGGSKNLRLFALIILLMVDKLWVGQNARRGRSISRPSGTGVNDVEE